MNRETRKANLKKLQLQNNSSSDGTKRSTRSTKITTTTTTISNYFNPPATHSQENPKTQTTTEKHNPSEENGNLPLSLPNEPTTSAKAAVELKQTRAKRTKLTAFVLRDDDFEPLNEIRKAPKIKKPTATTAKAKTRTKTETKTRNKRQPNIKSAFLRNEQIFSEITAQHCIADNFSPDDVELALAISKSEVEIRGNGNADSVNENCEEVVELLDSGGKPTENADESIRTKLRKYGFRTAEREDYSTFTATFLTGVNRRHGKCKWANKFTALTLRNPEHQMKKINHKIETFLAQELKVKHVSDAGNHLERYQPIADILKQCMVLSNDQRIVENFTKMNVPTTANMDTYYVKDLFEVTTVSAGHLLKDWNSIQGRDLSPKPKSRSLCCKEAKLKAIYTDLEEHFNARVPAVEIVTNDNNDKENIANISTNSERGMELNELLKLIEANDSNIKDLTKDSMIPLTSPLKEPPDKRLKLTDITSKTSLELEVDDNSKISASDKQRETSPDIFADSDVEMDTADSAIKSPEAISKDIQDITTYEIYSSDEAKTASHNGDTIVNCIKTAEGLRLIDLTQNDDNDPGLKSSPINLTQTDSNDQEIKENLINLTQNDSNDQILKSSPINLPQNHSNDQSFKSILELTPSELPAKSNTTLYHSLLEGAMNMTFLDELVEQKKEEDSLHTIMIDNDAVLKELREKYLRFETLNENNEKSHSLTQIDQIRALKRSFTMTSVDNHNLSRYSADDSEITIARKCEMRTMHRRSKSTMLPVNLPETSSAAKLKLSCSSIDLTQGSDMDDEANNGNDECIVLSDDEINYSIWKANETRNTPFTDELHGSDLENIENPHEFSVLDLIADEDSPIRTISPLSFGNTSIKRALSAPDLPNDSIKIDDILENRSFENEPVFKTPTKLKDCDTADISLLQSAGESNAPMRRFHSEGSARKFNNLLRAFQETEIGSPPFDDFDEYDKLIYGSLKKKSPVSTNSNKTPQGMEQLLTAKINLTPQHVTPIRLAKSPVKHITPTKRDTAEEVIFEGRSYSVRICNSPVPDYSTYSDDKLLKILYDFGIKPLKRAQAVKLLQYIYDVTHPLVEDETEEVETLTSGTTDTSDELNRLYSKYGLSQPISAISNQSQNQKNKNKKTINTQSSTNFQIANAEPKLNMQDCNGELLLRYKDELCPDLLPDELYIMPTNVTKKTARPLLPFHIAWHNLLCSSRTLHETILSYEPIDLQEIYLFLKSLGYRYEPKEMKTFFDCRCIIFRYDLTVPGKPPSNRHVRKSKTKS